MKSTIKSSTATAALTAGLLLAGAAHADIVQSGGAPSGNVNQTFDSLPVGSSTSATLGILTVKFTAGDSKTVSGAAGGVYAAPYLSGGVGSGFGQTDGTDTTTYLSTGIGSVELDFTQNLTYLGLLWGSIDTYNEISFYDGTTLIKSFDGGQVLAGANGDQGPDGTLYANFTSDTAFNRVVLSSTQYAFEFDDVSYKQSIDRVVPSPEPVTLSVFAAGLAGMGAMRRRRKA